MCVSDDFILVGQPNSPACERQAWQRSAIELHFYPRLTGVAVDGQNAAYHILERSAVLLAQASPIHIVLHPFLWACYCRLCTEKSYLLSTLIYLSFCFVANSSGSSYSQVSGHFLFFIFKKSSVLSTGP